MDIISVIKVTWVFIVSMYVRLTEIFKSFYNLDNTVTALKEKNKESVATKKSQLQLKHIKSVSIISKNWSNVFAGGCTWIPMILKLFSGRCEIFFRSYSRANFKICYT